MADPTLKIRITGDLDQIRKQLRDLGTDTVKFTDAAKQAGSSAAQGFSSAERAAQALTAQLNTAATAARAQRDATRDARRAAQQQEQDARRAAREQERLLRTQREAEKKVEAERATAAAKKVRDEQRAADASRRQASNRTAQVAPQITDIFTQLAGGGNPLLVLIQQGGQLRDIFGGVSQAIAGTARAIIGLVSPIGIAIGSVLALTAAYFKGQDEALAFDRAITSTGNSAGKTSDQLQEMAQRLGSLDGSTVSSAAATITQVVESGKFAVDQIEAVSRAAEEMRNATGRDVAETIGEFARIAEKPTETVDELNRKYGFLTGTLREQIRTLEEQGRTQEAATLAVNAYASAIDKRAPQIRENLGYIQRGWNAVTEAARGATDAALEMGRDETSEEVAKRLAAEQQQIQEMLAGGNPLHLRNVNFNDPATRKRLEARIEQIKVEMKAISDAEGRAQEQASKDAAQKRAVALQGELSDEARQLEEAGQKRARIRVSVINRTNEAIAAAQIAGDEAAAKAAKEARDRILANLDKQDQEDADQRDAKAKRKKEEAARIAAGVAGTQTSLVTDSVKRSLDELDEFYSKGKISLEDYYKEKQRLELESLDAQQRLAETNRDAAQDADDRAKAELEITKIQRDRSTLSVRLAREEAEARKELTRTIEDQHAALKVATGEDPLATTRLQLERQREEMLKAINQLNPNDEASKGLVNQVFDVELARARRQQIENEASQLLNRLRQLEDNIALQDQAGNPGIVEREKTVQEARQKTIEQLEELRKKLQEVLDTSNDAASRSAAADSLHELDNEIQRVRISAAKVQNQVKDLGQSSLENFFNNIASGAMKAKDAFKAFVVEFVQGIARMASEALSKRIIGSIGGGLGKFFAGVFHGGGQSGHGVKRALPAAAAALFALAPRFHEGGVAGLNPGEIPAILKPNERVLTAQQNDALQSQQIASPGTRIVNVIDPSITSDYLESAAGEETILNIIGRNPGRVKELIR